MGKSSGGDGSSEATVRYADYVEAHHSAFLDETANQVAIALPNSPFAGIVPIDYMLGFFGIGYALSSFPSLYDMYGKFMAGLDVDALYTQLLQDSINNPAIDNLVSDHAAELADDIIQNTIPRFTTGMRDINSVVSSSFIVGKAMIETARIKALSKYDMSLRVSMIPVAGTRWSSHLGWNKDVVEKYAQLLKFYFITAMDLDNHNYSQISKDTLWPFTILDFQRVNIAAMQGALSTKSDVAGASTTSKAIGGAMVGGVGGALAGAEIGATYGTAGGPWGAAIGGVVGAIGGAAMAYL